MMATTKHKAYRATVANALTTEMNSLANNGNTAASATIDNTTNLDLYHDLTLNVAAQAANRTAGASIVVYLIMALDGTTFDATNETTAEVVAVFPLDGSQSAARQLTRRDIPIPPGLFKYFVRNITGQTLAASGNILEYRAHSVETA